MKRRGRCGREVREIEEDEEDGGRDGEGGRKRMEVGGWVEGSRPREVEGNMVISYFSFVFTD